MEYLVLQVSSLNKGATKDYTMSVKNMDTGTLHDVTMLHPAKVGDIINIPIGYCMDVKC